MTFCRIAVTLAACALVSIPCAADVTLQQKTSAKGGLAGAMSSDNAQYIKGARMRTDQKLGDQDVSTIIDAGAQRMIVLNHRKREADVYDMTKIAQDMSKIAKEDIKASVTATGQTRQIAGAACAVHDMTITVPMQMGNDRLQMVMTGPVCLAKGGPGAADYAAFYRAAAERGLFFGDPRQAKAQPGQAKGMTELYREMATRGVPYSSEIQMRFEGSGMMASMMNKMGGMTMTTEVQSVSSASIPDATFEVPAGYKTKNH